jgi:uncharacterized protein (DUF305 family)
MKHVFGPSWGIIALAALAACGTGTTTPTTTPAPTTARPAPSAAEGAPMDSVRHSATQADVDFMTGMIHHHAQAIVMSRWAPTHGARAEVQVLASRIINAQQDEIRTMQNWLRDHGRPVPDVSAEAAGMAMSHNQHMAGMLTKAQLEELDAAGGEQFDQLFLRGMIQHHSGAVDMVDSLFGSYGAAQNDQVYKIASDISADQTTEIERMRKMLSAIVAESWSRK